MDMGDKKLEKLVKKYLILRDSVEDERVNQILDKIIRGEKINKGEMSFLEKFESISNSNLKDYSHISKNMIFEIVQGLLIKSISVICDLTDKNGKINDEIFRLENNFEENNCKIFLKRGEFCFLYDNFLYNLIYNVEKSFYSLTIQDEYFEKITVGKNED